MEADHQEEVLTVMEKGLPRPLTDTMVAGQCSPSRITSPVTDLARNLDGLRTSSRGGTPCRRISWSSNEDTPDNLNTFQKSRLFLGGNMASSPQMSCLDSPMFQDRLLRDVSVADNCVNTSGSRLLRRVRTLPHSSRPQLQGTFGKENIPKCQQQLHQRPKEERSSPSKSLYPHHLTSSSSVASSVSSAKCDNFFGDCLQGQENAFAAPSMPIARRIFSPLKSIANHQSLTRLNSTGSSFGCSSSERSISVSGAESDDIEDGFLDVFDMEALDSDASSMNDLALPSDFYRLLKDPLSTHTSENQGALHYTSDEPADSLATLYSADSPKRPPIRRCLSMIEESPMLRHYTSPRDKLLECVDRNNNFGSSIRKPEDTRKRLLQDEEEHTFKKPSEPLSCLHGQRSQENISNNTQETKRRKSVSYLTKSPSDSLVLPSPRILVQRSHSETDAITRALHQSSRDPNLIGDCSGSFALPLVKGRHDDLKSISSTTLSNLINGVYKDSVDEFQIVDCRYPYEFEGGHIKGACNLYTKESILESLVNHQPTPSSNELHKILVFHCEFSSERGPNLSRFLRNKDREANKDNYPSLFHPEIYLLEGGYREFYNEHKELCIPQDYLPMLSKDHEKDLRKFRSKSKSWSGDTKSRLAVRPGLKL